MFSIVNCKLRSYNIQHCFICRPSDSTVPTDAEIKSRTVATCALAVRRSNHQARSHPQLGQISSATRLDLIRKLLLYCFSQTPKRDHDCCLLKQMAHQRGALCAGECLHLSGSSYYCCGKHFKKVLTCIHERQVTKSQRAFTLLSLLWIRDSCFTSCCSSAILFSYSNEVKKW